MPRCVAYRNKVSESEQYMPWAGRRAHEGGRMKAGCGGWCRTNVPGEARKEQHEGGKGDGGDLP